ncbi:MAG: class I SAM-dependent methyltransferase [Anaerolineae bacterium]|nr:class I SAM-dependent methyltransferase [Anaerolineae bacterium]
MHRSTLNNLICPRCQSSLRLVSATDWFDPHRLRSGEAACACRRYPVRDGVLDLAPTLDGITPAQWSNVLPLTAWGYERFWRRRSLSLLSGEAFPVERELGLVWDMLQPVAEGLYLDLGCSTALQARGLAARLRGSSRVVAVDFSAAMLREAARLVEHEGVTRVDLVRARGERLPFEDGQLAGIVCGGSLNEFSAAWPVLVEARRALHAEGRAVFMSLLTSTTERGQRVQRLMNAASGIKFWTPDDTASLFHSAGWRVLDQRRWGMVLFSSLAPDACKP